MHSQSLIPIKAKKETTTKKINKNFLSIGTPQASFIALEKTHSISADIYSEKLT